MPQTAEKLPVLSWREDVCPADILAVREISQRSGAFLPEEVEIVAEMVEEVLQKGAARTGYHFIFAEAEGALAAYICVGEIPLTDRRFDLYWIVVAPEFQRGGLGQELLRRGEAQAVKLGAVSMYIDTSGKASYAGTRSFYEKCGYGKVCELPDFYRDGDAKIIYGKALARAAAAGQKAA